MSLIKTWAPYFQSSARMRGRGYYVSGRVRRLAPEAGEMVRAQVQGRQQYMVNIRSDGDVASVQCTCPRFASGHYCKPIWATLKVRACYPKTGKIEPGPNVYQQPYATSAVVVS